MQHRTQIDTVRRFIEQVWNEGQSETIPAFIAPAFRDRAYHPQDADGHKAMVETLKHIMPDAHWTIDSLIGDDNQVVVELTLRGTHQQPFRGVEPKGNAIEVRCYRTFIFEGDLMVEHRALLDTDRLLKQMAGTKPA